MTHHSQPARQWGENTLDREARHYGKERKRKREVCIIWNYYQHHIRAQRALKKIASVNAHIYTESVCECVSICVYRISVCMCVSSLTFRGLGFIFLYGGSPILIKSGPIRASAWLKALESVTLVFIRKPREAEGMQLRDTRLLLKSR